MVMFDFQPFSTNDWNSYAGAQPFADGRDPLISVGGLCIDGAPTEMVIDARSLQIFWIVDDQPYSVIAEGAEGTRLLALLRPNMRHAEIAALPGVEILPL